MLIMIQLGFSVTVVVEKSKELINLSEKNKSKNIVCPHWLEKCNRPFADGVT